MRPGRFISRGGLLTPEAHVLLTRSDLIPDGDALAQAAYRSTVGDPAAVSIGVHGGRNPDRIDTGGLTKRAIYDAARTGKLPFFNALAARLEADPNDLPRSLRSFIPKAANRTRPIDDPSELKRLIALHVRSQLERRLEAVLTDGQFGGRPAWAVKPTCRRAGATHQDHVATGIHDAIRTGRHYSLLLDLKDAFGQVPAAALLKALTDLRLDAEAANWIWRVVKIDAVNAKDRRNTYSSPGLGIEQGNPLSASLMNLVIAPSLKAVESSLPVNAYAYLDDLYVMAPTHAVAQEAYARLRQSLEARGFRNVRPLKNATDSKNSTIVDARVEPIPVLKTYLVNHHGVTLDPVKVVELRAFMRTKPTFNELRRLAGTQSITKKATKLMYPDQVRADRVGGSAGRTSPPTAVGDTPSGGGVQTIEPLQGRSSDLGGTPEEGKLLNDGELPDEGMHSRLGGTPEEGKLLSYREPWLEYLWGETHPVEAQAIALKHQGEDQSPGGWTYTPGDKSVTEPGQGNDTDQGLLVSHQCRDFGNKAGGTHLDGRHTGGSAATEGRNCQGRGRDGAADPPARLSILDPAVQACIAARRGLGAAGAYKGAVLDLTAADEALPSNMPSGSRAAVVNGLLRAVRTRRLAEVVFDPISSLSSDEGLLGGPRDPVYSRRQTRVLEDGTIWALLRQRATRRRHRRRAETPPRADLVVSKIRQVNRSLSLFAVQYVYAGATRRLEVAVDSPSPVAGSLQALAELLVQFPKGRVEVRLHGLSSSARVLLLPAVAPRNVALRDAFRCLRSREWTAGTDGLRILAMLRSADVPGPLDGAACRRGKDIGRATSVRESITTARWAFSSRG